MQSVLLKAEEWQKHVALLIMSLKDDFAGSIDCFITSEFSLFAIKITSNAVTEPIMIEALPKTKQTLGYWDVKATITAEIKEL